MSEYARELDHTVSPELASLDAAIGRLASGDAAGAPAGLEERVFAVSRTAISPLPRDIAPVSARLDQLANAEKAAARAGLEDSAFELSREAVASGRFLDPAPTGATRSRRLAGDGEFPRVSVRSRSLMRALSLAAAIAVAGGAVAVWRFSRPTPVPDQNVAVNHAQGQTADQLAARVTDEMDVLFEVIGTEHAASSTDTTDPDQDHDAAWIDNLFNKESL